MSASCLYMYNNVNNMLLVSLICFNISDALTRKSVCFELCLLVEDAVRRAESNSTRAILWVW